MGMDGNLPTNITKDDFSVDSSRNEDEKNDFYRGIQKVGNQNKIAENQTTLPYFFAHCRYAWI